MVLFASVAQAGSGKSPGSAAQPRGPLDVDNAVVPEPRVPGPVESNSSGVNLLGSVPSVRIIDRIPSAARYQ